MLITLSDDDILLLADALHQHSKLSTLGLSESNSFQSPIFLQFLQKVFHASSKSCLAQVDVDNSQYYPAMKQLESYQASRQKNGLPKIYLKIYNLEAEILPAVNAESKAKNKYWENFAYWCIATPNLHYCVLCLQPSEHVWLLSLLSSHSHTSFVHHLQFISIVHYIIWTLFLSLTTPPSIITSMIHCANFKKQSTCTLLLVDLFVVAMELVFLNLLKLCIY